MNTFTNNLKVALVQKNPIANCPKENLNLGLTYIQEAKALNADIVLFPELWSNGYAPPYKGAFKDPFAPEFEKERVDWLNEAIEEDSDYVKSFQRVAKELQIGVVITYLSKGKTAPENTALVIDTNGEILMKYSKVHTCDFSLEALLESGKEFKVCDFLGVKLGVMICYDREFPESARILMLEGAEIILVPNACGMNPARLNQLSTRAFENMVGIAMANYPSPRHGCSCAFSPIVFDQEGNYIDNTILMAAEANENIYIAEFKLDQIRDYREKETWGNAYRKVYAYGKLLDSDVKEPFVRA